MDEKIASLDAYLEQSSRIVALTGAGISIASGGMSFEGADPASMKKLMGLGSVDMLKNEPDAYYELLDEAFLHSMFTNGPSVAHRALKRLEDRGKLLGIITTNIDCLHSMAGSKNVAEIQGSFQLNKCVDCGCHYDDYDIWAHGKVPECGKCGGKIWTFPFYSNIGLDRDAVKRARKMIRQADLILIIGATGNYGDAYWPYRNRRAKIVQINPGHTGFDQVAKLNIRRDADSVFSELEERSSK